MAKELGITSKEVLARLSEQGEYVKSASSTVEAPVARRLREYFTAKKAAEQGPEKADEKADEKAAKGGKAAAKKSPAKAAEAPAAPAEIGRASCRERV